MPDERPRKTGRRWSILKKLTDDELDRRTTARNKTFNEIRKTQRAVDPAYDQHLKETAKAWVASLQTTVLGWARLRVNAIRSVSKGLALPFDLTPEYLVSIYPADGLCPYLQLPLVRGSGNGPLTASVDRIIPPLGYIQGNVRVISRRANSIKNDCVDPDIFRRIADQLEQDLCAQYR
jgi:hypothetical protein